MRRARTAACRRASRATRARVPSRATARRARSSPRCSRRRGSVPASRHLQTSTRRTSGRLRRTPRFALISVSIVATSIAAVIARNATVSGAKPRRLFGEPPDRLADGDRPAPRHEHAHEPVLQRREPLLERGELRDDGERNGRERHERQQRREREAGSGGVEADALETGGHALEECDHCRGGVPRGPAGRATNAGGLCPALSPIA